MHVNCIIDLHDDIRRFFALYSLVKKPIREYLSDGWRTMPESMSLKKFERPLLKTQSVLGFAADFGRFIRHFVNALPNCVACTDILPDYVIFLREQVGVDVFYYASSPEEITYPQQHKLIFVASQATHLPVERWVALLKHPHRRLAPGGLLVFSVRNEKAAMEVGVTSERRRTHFIRSIESLHLGSYEYGTTFRTDTFVTAQIESSLSCKPVLHKHIAFWVGQDAVIVSA